MSLVEDTSPTLLSNNGDSGPGPDPPAIHVHVQLPTGTQTTDDEVLLWTWVRTLQVPLASLLRISPLQPWRWILFACGVIMGTAGGTLRTSADLDDAKPIDLDGPPPTDNVHIYFHILEADREKLVPVEPDLRNSSRTASASSSESEQQWELKERLASRDKTCVVSGVDFLDICTAAHLIPRVKEDVHAQYIENVTRRHVEHGYPGAQLVTDIDDVRNAILVAASIHACLGKSVGIMKTPNFAFPFPELERWEFHVLDDAALASMTLSSAPHGKAIAVPERRANWPPSALFDQVYASAVFNLFNTKDENIKKSLKDMSTSYYGSARPMSDVQHVDADADKDEEDEGIPEFAIWQRLLPPDMQHRVYAALLQKGQEKARAASSQRVLEWRRHVE